MPSSRNIKDPIPPAASRNGIGVFQSEASDSGSIMRFGGLRDYQWFRLVHPANVGNQEQYGRIFQKLPVLNGSNAYCFGRGYAWFSRWRRVRPIATPELSNHHQVGVARPVMMLELYDDGTWRQV